jgi:hypothetical protein
LIYAKTHNIRLDILQELDDRYMTTHMLAQNIIGNTEENAVRLMRKGLDGLESLGWVKRLGRTQRHEGGGIEWGVTTKGHAALLAERPHLRKVA